MSKCRIETGAYTQMATCSSSSGASVAQNNIIFDALSSESVSDIIELPFGKAWVLTVYDLPEDGKIFINRGQPLRTEVPNGALCKASCNCAQTDVPIGNLTRIYTNGKMWQMTATDMLKVMSVPGYYQFELSDPDLLSVVTLEYQTIDLKHIPTRLFCGDCGCND